MPSLPLQLRLAFPRYDEKARVGANLWGQSSLEIEVGQSDLWRSSMQCLALDDSNVDKHTMKLLDIAF